MIGTRHKCNAHIMHTITVHLHRVAILRSCDKEFCHFHKMHLQQHTIQINYTENQYK